MPPFSIEMAITTPLIYIDKQQTRINKTTFHRLSQLFRTSRLSHQPLSTFYIIPPPTLLASGHQDYCPSQNFTEFELFNTTGVYLTTILVAYNVSGKLSDSFNIVLLKLSDACEQVQGRFALFLTSCFTEMTKNFR